MQFIRTFVRCECNYSVEYLYLGADDNYPTVYNYPAVCHTCFEVVAVNTKKCPVLCPICNLNTVKYYGTLDLLGEIVEFEFEHIDDELSIITKCEAMEEYLSNLVNSPGLIYSHYNYCPKCLQFRLQFHEIYNSNKQNLILAI
jgi:hypothetical protein